MRTPQPTVAVIDNYDSFTYNLVQYLAEQGALVTIYRNDATSVGELAQHDRVVISPGPGAPHQAGICLDAVRALSGTRPMFGICLGHQCIAEAFGAEVVRAAIPMHGKTSAVHHDGTGVFSGIPSPMTATRYHSLVVDPTTLPPELEISAWTDDGTVMGIRHRTHPTFGMQFHPESVLTSYGKQVVSAFLEVET
ncbi:aminodeoxychorismate/anthranilate synthase component II [Streptomyces sp. PRKS01-65]|nr:aminodeoxychorismate/anthranilate synthase component II [Streptomyces harenosi]NEY35724.1 aminodeoxychorismate/anthranilate synthase component II [Streptomyces harenosi]